MVADQALKRQRLTESLIELTRNRFVKSNAGLARRRAYGSTVRRVDLQPPRPGSHGRSGRANKRRHMTRTSELSTRRDAQKVSPSLEMLMKYEHDKVFTLIYLPLVMLQPAVHNPCRYPRRRAGGGGCSEPAAPARPMPPSPHPVWGQARPRLRDTDDSDALSGSYSQPQRPSREPTTERAAGKARQSQPAKQPAK